MDKLYAYKGEIVAMSPEQVGKALLEAEAKLRTGKFQYDGFRFVESQAKEIIAGAWPPEMLKAIQDEVRAIVPKGSPVLPETKRLAMLATARKKVAPARAEKAKTKNEMEHGSIYAEMALAALFGRAPDVSVPALQGRDYDKSGRIVRAKPSIVAKRLVVNKDEASGADFWVLAMNDEQGQYAMLLGWASKSDVQAAPCGNRTTDPDNCSWVTPAYYLPLHGLRPMSEFLSTFGLSKLPNGCLVEKVPALADLPIPSRLQMASGYNAEDFDFLASCGITSSKPTTTVAAVPKPPSGSAVPKSTVGDDDFDL